MGDEIREEDDEGDEEIKLEFGFFAVLEMGASLVKVLLLGFFEVGERLGGKS